MLSRIALIGASAMFLLSVGACPGGGGGGGVPTQTCAENPNQFFCQKDANTTDGTTGDTAGVDIPGVDTPGTDTNTDNAGPDGTCTPDCTGKTCGADGCGGFCGTCDSGLTCVSGGCIAGECGQTPPSIQGEFAVGQGITFDKVTLAVEHKMDIDEFEDGCLSALVIDLGKGFGCTLHVEAGTVTSPEGGLRITNLAFSADSQCPGFPDASEGEYTDFTGLTVKTVIPTPSKVADKNAPESCLTGNFEVKLEGVLRDSGGKTLNVGATTITVAGETKSIGSTTADCPCVAVCAGKECGDDGCGFDCGYCGEAGVCDSGGICQCAPSCVGKDCGDDGCGGSCGECGTFDTCVNAFCEACVPSCDGKTCGDDGCGGDCGSCVGNETCSAAGACECPNSVCTTGGCCDAGQVCSAAEACCSPDCDGKACGDDGCGGSCGDCSGNGVCDSAGICQCTPDCAGKACGDDGCGGSCGTCSGTDTCNTATGVCTPTSNLVCGPVNLPLEFTCSSTTNCECVGCVDDGACTAADDCVCAECAGDAFCGDLTNCNDDGICSPFNESCGCTDCVGHPQCTAN